MAYEMLALLTDKAFVTEDELHDLIRHRFECDPEAVVGRDAYVVSVSWGDWSIRAGISTEPEVAEECQELAETVGCGRPDQEAIRGCRRRIEVSADDDPNMDHFNDYCFIMELLEGIPGCLVFDPHEGKFTN